MKKIFSNLRDFLLSSGLKNHRVHRGHREKLHRSVLSVYSVVEKLYTAIPYSRKNSKVSNLIALGFIVLMATIITLAMWPVLVLMYYRLARREEGEALEAFGERYEEYKRQTPMFLPSIRKRTNMVVS